MSCPFCGSDNPSQSGFCRACGAELPCLNASDAADALPLGALLMGTYAVERVLGQGGFGITYCCHDQMLDRRVAVKEFFPSGCRRDEAAVQPSRGLSDSHFGEARAQFLAEARLLARCHHAGIVGVHTAFESNSTAYMVMELLHGSHLAQLLEARGGKLSEAEAVPLIERAGEALQFVHDQGLLHRDIKPDNIIVCDDGRVMLIDFGTAREYAQGQAQGHTIVVTPGYAPLEQYAKQAKRGAFTDVYGLAATLYHLLTGQAPPAASDRAVGVQLRPVREENPQVSAGVARAVEAGLEMEIAKRPQSVREFLELMHAPATPTAKVAAFEVDLRPQPVLTPDETMMAEARRNTLTALNAAPANFFSTQIQARQQMLNELLPEPQAATSPVQLAPLLAPQSALSAPVSPSAPSMSPPMSPYSGGHYAFRPASKIHDPSASVFWLLGGVTLFMGLVVWGGSCSQTPRSSSYSTFPGNSSPPSYSSSEAISSNYQPATPTISNAEAAREAARREIEASPAILPVSTENLPISAEKKLKLATGSAKLAELPHILTQGLAAFSPDGRLVAYRDAEAVVRVWSLAKHRVVSSLPQSKNHPPDSIRFSPDGKTLALTYQDQGKDEWSDKITVWNLATDKAVGTFSVDPKKASINVGAVFPDGTVPILKSGLNPFEQRLFLWNPRTGKQSAVPTEESSNVARMVFAAYGQQVVTGNSLGHIRWLDARTGAQKAEQITYQTYQDFQDSAFYTYTSGSSEALTLSDPLPVKSLRFSTNGAYLASRNAMQVRVFDSKAQEVGTLPIGGQSAFAVSPDGQFVVEGGGWQPSQWNVLWNVRSLKKIRLQAPVGQIRAWNFSPDGKRIIGISSSPEGTSLVTWPTEAKPIVPFSSPQITPLSLTTTSYGSAENISQLKRLTAMKIGQRLEIRRFDGSTLHFLDVGTSPDMALAFSADGWFLSGHVFKGGTRIWNVETGQQVGQLELLQPPLQPLQDKQSLPSRNRGYASQNLIFSPDHSLMARSGSAQGKNLIEVWSLKKTFHRVAVLPLRQPLTTLTFSLDNRALICSDENNKLRLYDVATQKLIAETENGPAPVTQIVPTERGLAVVSIVREGKTTAVVTMYDVPSNGNTRLASGQRGGDFFKKKEIVIDDVRSTPNSLAVSPDGRFVAAAFPSDAAENGVNIWQLATGSLMQRLPVSSSPENGFPSGMPFAPRVGTLMFSPDGSQLSCFDRTMTGLLKQIIVWQAPPREEPSR